nr:reverse transcriptase domain-containing protein [Tanacetum cinerariifolium]
MADTRTMSELLQATTKGYGVAIVIPAILAENFELKVDLLSLTTNLKNDITNFQQRFDETFSEAWDHFKDLLRKCPHHGFSELHQIKIFYNSLTQSDQDSLNAAAGGNLLKRTPRDALMIIENNSKVRTSRNKLVVSKVNTNTSSSSPCPNITALTEIIKELVLMNKAKQQASVKAVEETCVTCGGLHPYYECLATGGNTFDACEATGTYNQGVFLKGTSILPTSFLLKEVEREPKVTKDKVKITSSKSTAHVQPLVVLDPILEPKVASKPNTRPLIPYPLRLNDQKLREKANNQMLKFLQIFQRLQFDISFTDALLHMPKFASTFKNLLSNKEKLFELESTPLNENCSVVLLKKLPEKPRDAGKFLISCDFPELEVCLALADLGAGINLMALSVWKKLSLPEHTPTCMTLELANRSVAYPELVNRIDVIDVSCEEHAQEVLRFLDSSTSGNPIPSDPIIASSSPSSIPFEGNDFILEETETFLRTPYELSTLDDDFDPEGDIALIEKLLNEDPSPNLPPMKNEDLKQADEKCHFIVKERIVLGHKISKSGIKVDRAKVDVIAKLLHPTFIKEKETPFILSKDCIEAFNILKKKLTEAPILVAPDWDLPFEIMCDASDFAVGAVLGQPENLAADPLSRLENPHEGDLEKKEINETFPLETLAMITFHEIPYGESKVHIEVLSVFWRNRLPIHEDKLDDALWAFCTAFKTPIECTPYKLVYRKACHLPIKLERKAYWALKHCNFDLKIVGDRQKDQINELNELQDQAYKNSLINEEKTKKIHDSKIKNRVFNASDRVLLFNSRLKIFSSKLKTYWTRPFTVA